MKILTCSKCQSQFDVSSMQPGSSFVCGKCRNVLEVPAAAPVVQPAPVVKPIAPPAQSGAPATVVLSPDEMRRALAAARGQAPEAPAAKSGPKLPAAMEARRQQQQQAQSAARAGGASAPAPAPAPRAAAPAARPAAAPAPAARPAPAAQPARAAAPAPAAKAAAPAAEKPAAPASGGRASRRARGGDEGEEAPKKPPVGVYAGIAVAAVVAIGGIVVVMSKGDSKPADTDPAQAPTGAGGTTAQGGGGSAPATPEPVPANLDEWQKYLRLSDLEKTAQIAKERANASGDAAKLKVLYDWFSDPRLASDRQAKEATKNIVADALRVDANTDWANQASGRVNLWEFLRKTQQDCAKAFQYAETDEKALEEAMKKAENEKWVDPKEFARLETVANRVRERSRRLDTEPRLLRVEDKKNWIRANQLFKEFTFMYRWSDPYLICQQYQTFTDPNEEHKNKDRIEKAITMANRDVIIFTELNRHYRSLFAERYKLPELKEKDRILFAVITWNHESYADFYRKANNGENPAPFIRAFYSPPEQKIFHYLGDDSLRSQDELPTANGFVQKNSDQVTFHEGTHQLQHEYGSIFRGKPLKDGDTNVPPRKAMWFDEGMAEFMGAVEVETAKKDTLEGATFLHNRLLLERLQQVQGNMKNVTYREEALRWTIAEMIVPNHNGELLQASGRLMPNNPVYMANLFYARAWGFVHFCWFYAGGKYRKNLLDYQEKVFLEEHGPDALAKAFGRKSAKDWAGIQEEFDFYWNRCLARRIGYADPVGKARPFNTETDAPTEVYDPNAKDE